MDYIVFVYVILAVLIIVLIIAVLYVCFARRYRLNWFEHTLLLDSEKVDKSVLTTSAAVQQHSTSGVTVGHVYLQPGVSDHTVYVDMPRRASADDKYVSRRTDTIPHTTLDTPGSTSSNKTPTSSSSMQDMAFNFSEPRGSDAGLPIMPTAQRQRRRASMQDALDHTKINAQLYDDVTPPPSTSIVSSIDEETIGAVQLSVRYDNEQSLLVVHLMNALGLVPRNLATTGSPYCRLSLLPCRRVQLQSKVCSRTLSPCFDEEFIFDVARLDSVADLTLEILIFDYDRFSRDEVIGAVHIPLSQLDLAGGVIASLRKGIMPFDANKEENGDQGDIMLSMSYLQSAERLTVVVMKARNLQPVSADSAKTSINPFVKVSLLYDGKRAKKKKTTSKRNTCNPVWHEALTFSLSRQLLAANTTSLEVSVYDDSLLGNNECLGRVSIGAQTAGEQLAQWNDVCHVKNAISRWHQLTLANINSAEAASTNST